MDALIIADDLSGAADCVAAAHCGGVVALSWPPAPQSFLVAIDLDSRDKPPNRAGALATDAVSQLVRAETQLIYQKMDSILRGNWTAELVHIRSALRGIRGNSPLAVIAPAWPERGRTLLGGDVLIGGRPLQATGLRRDDAGGTCGSVIAQLAAAGISSVHAPAGQSPGALAMKMEQARSAGVAAMVCDTRERADLDQIAAAGALMGTDALMVGSGGLMGSVSGALGWRRIDEDEATRLARASVLIVIGSSTEVSQRQVVKLQQAGVVSIALPAAVLLQPTQQVTREASDRIARALAGGRTIALSIVQGTHLGKGVGAELVTGLTELARPFLAGIGGLILTGGETARAVLTAAGVTGIRITDEVEAGVPIGQTLGRIEVPVITKAGAFGSPDTLVRGLAMITGTVAAEGMKHINSKGNPA